MAPSSVPSPVPPPFRSVSPVAHRPEHGATAEVRAPVSRRPNGSKIWSNVGIFVIFLLGGYTAPENLQSLNLKSRPIEKEHHLNHPPPFLNSKWLLIFRGMEWLQQKSADFLKPNVTPTTKWPQVQSWEPTDPIHPIEKMIEQTNNSINVTFPIPRNLQQDPLNGPLNPRI